MEICGLESGLGIPISVLSKIFRLSIIRTFPGLLLGNSRMTFIDAMAALQEGAIPTNDQCVAFLQHLEVSLPSRDGMSEKGSSLVLDLKTFFEVICGLLQERNGREELQEFLWRTRGAAHDLNHQGLKLKWGKDADRDSVGNKAKKAKAKVERAGEAIQTNGEQGKYIISDYTSLIVLHGSWSPSENTCTIAFSSTRVATHCRRP